MSIEVFLKHLLYFTKQINIDAITISVLKFKICEFFLSEI